MNTNTNPEPQEGHDDPIPKTWLTSAPAPDPRGYQLPPVVGAPGRTAFGTPTPQPAPVLGPTSAPLVPAGAPPSRTTRHAKRGNAALLIVAAVMSAVVGAGAGVGGYAVAAGGQPRSTISISTVSPAGSAVTDGTVSAAAAKILPSVVTITVRSGRSGDIGTGIVLDKQGHVLTNAHVVAEAGADATITLTTAAGATASAKVVGADDLSDLAVLVITGGVDASSLSPATFASSAVTVGQAVVAVGAPLGLTDTVTSGIVSTTHRAIRSGADGKAVYLAIQTDTPINPGNSGGPLVDLDGNVVGINAAIASTAQSATDTTQPGSIGIGFSIPAGLATRVAENLIASGTSPTASLGVSVPGAESATPDPTATGVTLAAVTAGGPAAEAGLRAGDEVTEIDDIRTTETDALIAAVRYYAPGTTVTVTYLRDGAQHTTQVTLGTA